MLRRTNYGLWVDDHGKSNKNELAIDYIVESARSVDIEVIEGETTLDMQFMAEVIKRLREKQEPKMKELDKIRSELIQSIQNGTLKIESGNEKLFRIIDKYRK